MITLTAGSDEWKNTPQYIARITGRDPKFTFRREFTGTKHERTTTAYVDEPGIYEVCDIDRKGRKDLGFRLIVARTAACPPLSESSDPSLSVAPKPAVIEPVAATESIASTEG